jgi:hypothetical protein
MPVSHAHRTIFIHIPRSAGTSVSVALGICQPGNTSDNSYRPSDLFGFDGRHFAQHLTAREVCSRVGRQKFADYFKFAIVRNPYARLVSAYYQGFAKGDRGRTDVEGFRRFVRRHLPEQCQRPLEADRHRHLKSQSVFVVDESGREMVDFIGHAERLPEDMHEVARRIGAAIDIPHLNRTHDFDVEAHFDADARRVTHELYGEDFDRFGYRR